MRARACEPTRFDAASIGPAGSGWSASRRSEEHTSELQSRSDLVCRLLLEKKKKNIHTTPRRAPGYPANPAPCARGPLRDDPERALWPVQPATSHHRREMTTSPAPDTQHPH